MNKYEQKQAARKERLENASDKAASEGDRRFSNARAAVEGMTGEPIHVGHYSEGRHRAAFRRHDTNMRAAIEAQERAQELARRAASVGTGGISSDDPDAVLKLQEELATLQARQARYKAVNDAHRRFLKKPESLDKAELSDAEKKTIRDYKPAYSWEPHPYPPYSMQNNGANIRRIEKRIAELRRRAERVESAVVQAEATGEPVNKEYQCNGYRVVSNLEENRVQLIFPGKPAQGVRRVLKSNGFRWAPTEGAWQRHHSEGLVSMVSDAEGYLRKQIENALSIGC